MGPNRKQYLNADGDDDEDGDGITFRIADAIAYVDALSDRNLHRLSRVVRDERRIRRIPAAR